MKYFLNYMLSGSIVLMMLIIMGCRGEVEQTPKPAQSSETSPLNITYCDISPSDLCLEGFGQEGEDKTLILFKSNDQSFANIFVRVEKAEGDVLFECMQPQNFSENVYCQGDAFLEDEKIKLDVFSKSDEKLVAIGVFNVQYSAIPTPVVEFGSKPPTSEVRTPGGHVTSTPGASYPNYPNPSYPNSTPIP